MHRSLSCLVLAVVFLLHPTTARAASITLSAVPASPNPLQMFELRVGVSDAPDLFGYDLAIFYNPLAVSFVDAINGDLLSSSNFASFNDADLGLAMMAISLEGGVGGVLGNGLLASFVFRALTEGTADILLDATLYNSSEPDPQFPIPTNVILHEVIEGGVTVVPVPEPSTLALLGVGLAAMARRRLKRKIAA